MTEEHTMIALVAAILAHSTRNFPEDVVEQAAKIVRLAKTASTPLISEGLPHSTGPVRIAELEAELKALRGKKPAC